MEGEGASRVVLRREGKVKKDSRRGERALNQTKGREKEAGREEDRR